jgi:hypothetical protein
MEIVNQWLPIVPIVPNQPANSKKQLNPIDSRHAGKCWHYLLQACKPASPFPPSLLPLLVVSDVAKRETASGLPAGRLRPLNVSQYLRREQNHSNPAGKARIEAIIVLLKETW